LNPPLDAGTAWAVAVAIAAALGAAAWQRRGARHDIGAARPDADALPAGWRELLANRVRLYRALPQDLRAGLEPLLRAFLERVEFVGCNGLVVTDAMRLVIGAQACMLLLRRGAAALEPLHGVMLYPGEFVVDESDEDELTGVVTEGQRALSGQTVETDRIVLSWPDVEDAQARDDGYNVVIHEFAHFLDHGALPWPPGLRATLDTEYAALCAAVDADEPTLLDPYGAEDTAEFFAVATEAFMELPQDLREQHPQLHAALCAAYGFDPATWEAAPA
jgi:MtfA peptidase